jgi:hypothetical protein
MATRTLEDAIKKAALRLGSDSEYINAVVLDNANVKELMASRKRSRASTPEHEGKGRGNSSSSNGKNNSEASSSSSGSNSNNSSSRSGGGGNNNSSSSSSSSSSGSSSSSSGSSSSSSGGKGSNSSNNGSSSSGGSSSSSSSAGDANFWKQKYEELHKQEKERVGQLETCLEKYATLEKYKVLLEKQADKSRADAAQRVEHEKKSKADAAQRAEHDRKSKEKADKIINFYEIMTSTSVIPNKKGKADKDSFVCTVKNQLKEQATRFQIDMDSKEAVGEESRVRGEECAVWRAVLLFFVLFFPLFSLFL